MSPILQRPWSVGLAAALCLPLLLAAQTANQEFRATWVVTWELISPGADATANKVLAREILDNHAAANMNAVLWQARQNGTAYYNSSYEPWGTFAGSGDPGYDPLAYAVEEAHARGLELHAWMNTFESRNPVPGSPSYEHPEWICRDQGNVPMSNGAIMALSPGLPAVRSYLNGVAMELVRNYDIDGLHLDYIRWNEYTNSSSSTAFAKMIQKERLPDGVITPEQLHELVTNQAGRYLYDSDHPYEADPPDTFATWESYWRWSVTEFVRTLHDSIQAVKPWVRLSVAALGRYNWGGELGWNGYHRVYQDAALWYNEGYIDQLTPMHYHWVDGSSFRGVLLTEEGANWHEYIQPGIADGRLFTVGPPSYRLDSENIWGRHDEIVSQSRTVPFVDGFQFFSYGSWADHQYWLTAGRTIFPAKTKIRPWGLLAANPPGAPTLALTQPDSLTVSLSVTPPSGAEGGHWYAFYRSEEAAIDSSSDRIVALRLSDGTFDYEDEFDGLQDYDGSYTYAASALDRYRSESAPSNRVTSQAIPSLPPAVVQSSPAQGGTIRVEGPLSITFSKTMATGTLSGALHLTPVVSISALNWSADQHSVQINLAENLVHEVDYELRIDSTVTDINGVALDGNGDGMAGDSYRLSFRAEAEDVTAPLVWSSYPELDGSTTSIMGDEVISIVYDEAVEPASITDTTLVLSRAGTSVDLTYNLTNSGDRSILSAQATGGLLTNAVYQLRIRSGIRDLLGNVVASDLVADFRTATQIYTETIVIDNFATTGAWETPGFSGSTTGIISFLTTFNPSEDAFLPAATAPIQKRSAALQYEWDPDATEFLLREYLSGAPRDIVFDSSYTLQAFIFGDGSGNQFRFAVDDGRESGNGSLHEVSEWLNIDWYGWKLVEWQLSDPGGFGTWIGNGSWDHPNSIYYDSFQLTHPPGGAVTGIVYFDNLRAVKKAFSLDVAGSPPPVPQRLSLGQNYPNPFNAATRIPFALPARQRIEVVIYDLTGRRVKVLLRGELPAGYHVTQWRGDTDGGAQAASGVYVVLLKTGELSRSRRLLLLK